MLALPFNHPSNVQKWHRRRNIQEKMHCVIFANGAAGEGKGELFY